MAKRLLRVLQLRSLGAALWIVALTAAPVVICAHGPLDEQILELSRQIENQPQNARLYLQRGELYRLDGHISEAEADYEHAAKLDPTLHDTHLALARLWLGDGRPGEALAEVDEFIAREPERAEAFFVRARALAGLKRVPGAVAEMDRAIARAEAPRPAHYLERARLITESAGVVPGAGAPSGGEPGARSPDAEARRKAIERALRGLDDGLTRLGPVVTLQWYAIELEMERGRYGAALARLERIAPQYTRKETVLKRRGDILEAAGRRLEAQAAYTDALDAVMALPERVRRTPSIVELQAFLTEKLSSPTSEGSREP